MNIIQCVIKMKREAQSHYEKLAASVKGNELKRLFTLLAAAETEHIERLQELEESEHKNGFFVTNLQEEVCVYSPQIAARNMTRILRHDPDAYRHVLQEEEETIEFFDQLVAEAGNEQMKHVYQAVANRERQHLQTVENIYTFVEDPRTYLEWGEFSNLRSL
jgi:rubrerythrin